MSVPHDQQITIGELLTITLTMVPVTDVQSDTITVQLPGTGLVDVDRSRSSVIIERVAPAEWASLTVGDIWTDRDGDEWITVPYSDELVMHPVGPGLDVRTPDELLADLGPLTLVRRRGWTPPPAPADQVGADPTAAGERAAYAARLRAAADFVARRVDLPAPNDDVAPQYSAVLGDEVDRMAEVDRVAAILGMAAERNSSGTGYGCRYEVAPGVEYVVHTWLTPAPAAAVELVEVTPGEIEADVDAIIQHSRMQPSSVEDRAVLGIIDGQLATPETDEAVTR